MPDFHEGGTDGIRFGGSSPIDVTSPIRVLECIVVTPETTALQTPAGFVALPLYDGELGVLPGHSPFIGRLGYGELRLKEDGKMVRLYVDGGFVQVADGIVTVLTNNAVPAEKLNAAIAREHLAAARARKANTPELMAIRDRLEQQARAQLRMAERGIVAG
ncbi:MAG TPA: ATP synthase F1 subunit epsilon [Pirellulales bacterium]|jgi:F-type H+-transporting ATPase subunit epsilon|nr:ATP synthase F1 subunit epsilon [Pirellulales bacterium]